MTENEAAKMFAGARSALKRFKGRNYVHGLHCFDRLGEFLSSVPQPVAVVMGGIGKPWGAAVAKRVEGVLKAAGIEPAGEVIPGARPNTPREDVERIVGELRRMKPAAVMAVAGGSGIDAAKAAIGALALGEKHSLDECFGVGKVTELLRQEGARPLPLIAVQLAASSGAHLTKYSNITDPETSQKRLIVDGAIAPPRALFDYSFTVTMPKDLTADGALDGIAHAVEVLYGLKGEPLEKMTPVLSLAVDLILRYAKSACEEPDDLEAREALGLGTDLGGYAIMVGGTSGAHLTSFSLVDILSHGRACAIMNPYYTVLFAPAIEPPLRTLGEVFEANGYMGPRFKRLSGRDLGVAVAEAMMAFSREIGLPTRLSDVEGFTDDHIRRALDAAKRPELAMKLANMPVPLTAQTVDPYMEPVLQAAKSGDFSLIRNVG